MAFPYLSDALRATTGLDWPLPLPMFGLSVAFALYVGLRLFRGELYRLQAQGALAGFKSEQAPQQGLDRFVAVFGFVVTISGIVGARVFHLFEHVGEFTAHPWAMLLSQSGLSVMGGLVFGAVAGAVLVKRAGLPLRAVMDAAAPALMLGYALGRIGCQIAGDGDWGSLSNMALKPDWVPTWLWAQTYDNNILGAQIPSPGVYPTPLYETASALVLFVVLWQLRRHNHRTGWLFAAYLLMAGAERLLIEQIRVNPVLDFAGVVATQAELVSGVFILAGVVGLALCGHRKGVAQ